MKEKYKQFLFLIFHITFDVFFRLSNIKRHNRKTKHRCTIFFDMILKEKNFLLFIFDYLFSGLIFPLIFWSRTETLFQKPNKFIIWFLLKSMIVEFDDTVVGSYLLIVISIMCTRSVADLILIFGLREKNVVCGLSDIKGKNMLLIFFN